MSRGGGGLARHSVLDVCLFIDDLEDRGVGEIRFESAKGSVLGAVFVEGGRVCWAAARGLSQRLTDILANSAGLDPEKMTLLYCACRDRGVPLGEHLVATGLVSPAGLRESLRQHSTESLRHLAGEDATLVWKPRAHGGYSPAFTFSTTEILQHGLVAELDQDGATSFETAGELERELSSILASDDWGAAYHRAPGRSSPEPLVVHGAVGRVSAIVELGAWAASSLDVTSAARGDHGFVAGFHESGARVAWTFGRALLAGATDRGAPARLMNRLARGRRSGALHGDP